LDAGFSITGGTEIISSASIKIFPQAASVQAQINSVGVTRTTTTLSLNARTAGNGNGRLFLIREGYPPIPPSDGVEYVPTTDLSSAGTVGRGQTAPGTFAIFDESGNTFTPFSVSSLTAGARYYFGVFEYIGSGALRKYNTSISSANVVYDTTLTGSGDPYGAHSTFGTSAMIATDCDIYGAIPTTEISQAGVYYSFMATESRGNLMIRLSELPKDYNIRLYNSAGRLLRESANGSIQDEVMIINQVPSGKYFIKIYGADSAQFDANLFKFRVNTSEHEYMSQKN
jgi:hypothetical protein